MELWKRRLAIDSLVAFKLEAAHRQGLPALQELGERLTIFSRGLDSTFLEYQPAGMRAYFSVFAPIAPEITRRIWTAVRENRLDNAQQSVHKYEKPFFEPWGKLGALAFWRATLEYFEIASRWMRPPVASITDAQMRDVKEFYDQLGLRSRA